MGALAAGMMVTGNSLIPTELMTEITTSGSDIQASVTDVITNVTPIALAIMGLVLAVTVGIRLFKQMTKSAARP